MFRFFFQSDLQQLPIKGIWVKSMVKTFWFIAEEQWTDYLRLGFGPWHVPCYVPETAKNELLLLRELREGIQSHEKCCSLWLRYDS